MHARAARWGDARDQLSATCIARHADDDETASQASSVESEESVEEEEEEEPPDDDDDDDDDDDGKSKGKGKASKKKEEEEVLPSTAGGPHPPSPPSLSLDSLRALSLHARGAPPARALLCARVPLPQSRTRPDPAVSCACFVSCSLGGAQVSMDLDPPTEPPVTIEFW